jgi:hypothetical protein
MAVIKQECNVTKRQPAAFDSELDGRQHANTGGECKLLCAGAFSFITVTSIAQTFVPFQAVSRRHAHPRRSPTHTPTLPARNEHLLAPHSGAADKAWDVSEAVPSRDTNKRHGAAGAGKAQEQPAAQTATRRSDEAGNAAAAEPEMRDAARRDAGGAGAALDPPAPASTALQGAEVADMSQDQPEPPDAAPFGAEGTDMAQEHRAVPGAASGVRAEHKDSWHKDVAEPAGSGAANDHSRNHVARPQDDRAQPGDSSKHLGMQTVGESARSHTGAGAPAEHEHLGARRNESSARHTDGAAGNVKQSEMSLHGPASGRGQLHSDNGREPHAVDMAQPADADSGVRPRAEEASASTKPDKQAGDQRPAPVIVRSDAEPETRSAHGIDGAARAAGSATSSGALAGAPTRRQDSVGEAAQTAVIGGSRNSSLAPAREASGQVEAADQRAAAPSAPAREPPTGSLHGRPHTQRSAESPAAGAAQAEPVLPAGKVDAATATPRTQQSTGAGPSASSTPASAASRLAQLAAAARERQEPGNTVASARGDSAPEQIVSARSVGTDPQVQGEPRAQGTANAAAIGMADRGGGESQAYQAQHAPRAASAPQSSDAAVAADVKRQQKDAPSMPVPHDEL